MKVDKPSEGDSACQYCDSPGGKETLQNQVCIPLNGRVQCIDYCIHHLVSALNAANIPTVASCCGHGEMPGYIYLEDGRVLVIFSSPEEARMCDNLESTSHSRSIDDSGAWRPPRLDGTR